MYTQHPQSDWERSTLRDPLPPLAALLASLAITIMAILGSFTILVLIPKWWG